MRQKRVNHVGSGTGKNKSYRYNKSNHKDQQKGGSCYGGIFKEN